jgi:putative selenate reductase
VLDFFGDDMPDLTDRGYLRTDPETLETSLQNVYAGGDVGRHGPSSIVKAAADGKQMARSILGRIAAAGLPPHTVPADQVGLLARRAHREYRVPVRETALSARRSFDETLFTYSLEEAQAEASRCLDCDQMCSICVGVCPNLAILTYGSTPFTTELPTLEVGEGTLEVTGSVGYRVDQKLQVAVLTDFCNECGNCATFCPTAGRPYVDKPRLYLDEADFNAQSDNAFMLTGKGTMAGRWGGETHRITLNGDLTYHSPVATVSIDPATWEIRDADATGGGGPVTLEPAAAMYALLEGLQGSAPGLPIFDGGGGTRVAHPGYEE